MSEARSRRDDARYEPQIAASRRDGSQAADDPLAELARLVGQDDPFRSVFRPKADHLRVPDSARADPRAEPAPRYARDAADVDAGSHPDPHAAWAAWEQHGGDQGGAHGGARAGDGAWHPEQGGHDYGGHDYSGHENDGHGHDGHDHDGYGHHRPAVGDHARHDAASYGDPQHGHGYEPHGDHGDHGGYAEHGYDEG